MKVIYLDSYFFLNITIDYLLLLTCAKMTGAGIRRGRFLLGAAAGGAYSVFSLTGPGSIADILPTRAGICALIVLIAFGKRRLIKRSGIFFGLSMAFGGCVYAVWLLLGRGLPLDAAPGMRLLLPAAALCCFAVSLLFKNTLGHALEGQEGTIVIQLGERRVSLRALADTGNTLRDPVTGRPVAVVEAAALKGLTGIGPEEAADPLGTLERLSAAKKALGLRIIPYRAVGVGSGLLLAVKMDRIVVNGRVSAGMLAALSPTPVSDGGLYEALVGSGAL